MSDKRNDSENIFQNKGSLHESLNLVLSRIKSEGEIGPVIRFNGSFRRIQSKTDSSPKLTLETIPDEHTDNGSHDSKGESPTRDNKNLRSQSDPLTDLRNSKKDFLDQYDLRNSFQMPSNDSFANDQETLFSIEQRLKIQVENLIRVVRMIYSRLFLLSLMTRPVTVHDTQGQPLYLTVKETVSDTNKVVRTSVNQKNSNVQKDKMVERPRSMTTSVEEVSYIKIFDVNEDLIVFVNKNKTFNQDDIRLMMEKIQKKLMLALDIDPDN